MTSDHVILIITSVDDGHANAVIKHLNKSGANCSFDGHLITNTDCLIKQELIVLLMEI